MTELNVKSELMTGFMQKLENFRKLNIKALRKSDNFSWLTLKSEYSQDISGFLKESSIMNLSEVHDTSIENTSVIKDEANPKIKDTTSILKIKFCEFVGKIHVESIDNILNNIRVKTEENKLLKKGKHLITPKKTKLIEMKSHKKIKEKFDQNLKEVFVFSCPQKNLISGLFPGVKVVDRKENLFFYSQKEIDQNDDSSLFEKQENYEIPKENEENLFENIKPLGAENKDSTDKLNLEFELRDISNNAYKNSKQVRMRKPGSLSLKTQVQTSNLLARSISTSSKNILISSTATADA